MQPANTNTHPVSARPSSVVAVPRPARATSLKTQPGASLRRVLFGLVEKVADRVPKSKHLQHLAGVVQPQVDAFDAAHDRRGLVRVTINQAFGQEERQLVHGRQYRGRSARLILRASDLRASHPDFDALLTRIASASRAALPASSRTTSPRGCQRHSCLSSSVVPMTSSVMGTRPNVETTLAAKSAVRDCTKALANE